jgi:RNA polymerase sigma factor (sigma-70 family)
MSPTDAAVREQSDEPLEFEDLVRRHQRMVFSLAFHFLRDRAAAEEVAQDVFLRLHRHLDSLGAGEGVVFWLRRVTSNRCIDYARQRRFRLLSFDTAPEPAVEPHARDPAVAAAAAAGRVAAAAIEDGGDPPVSGGLDAGGDRAHPRRAGGQREEPAAPGAQDVEGKDDSRRGRSTLMTDMNDPIEPTVEKALRQALRAVDPPPGFAERVVQRASRSDVRNRFASGTWLRWATAAALVIAVSGGLWYRAEERRRTEGEEARRQVLLSLQIAGSKLNAVQMKINRRGESRQ